METLKLGSKGEAVKTLLKALKVNLIDGVFGNETYKLVVYWQKSHGLKADGVVGDKTWESLGIKLTNNSKCLDSSIIYKPLSVHVTASKGRPIKYLAIHFTAGSSSKSGKAIASYNTFTTRAASADFVVDDENIVQYNPDLANYYCWAVGDKRNPYSKGGQLYGIATNKNTISIEICSTCTPNTSTAVSNANHTGWSYTDKVLENARKLAKMIIKKYNIPMSNVVRHYDISGKLCPGIPGWNNEPLYTIEGKKTTTMNTSDKWIKFKESL